MEKNPPEHLENWIFPLKKFCPPLFTFIFCGAIHQSPKHEKFSNSDALSQFLTNSGTLIAIKVNGGLNFSCEKCQKEKCSGEDFFPLGISNKRSNPTN